jgi:hypothetical protein
LEIRVARPPFGAPEGAAAAAAAAAAVATAEAARLHLLPLLQAATAAAALSAAAAAQRAPPPKTIELAASQEEPMHVDCDLRDDRAARPLAAPLHAGREDVAALLGPQLCLAVASALLCAGPALVVSAGVQEGGRKIISVQDLQQWQYQCVVSIHCGVWTARLDCSASLGC